MSRDNQDQLVVVVTGASTGIGKSIALEFAKDRKFKVYATMRNVSSWNSIDSSNLIVKSLDVTSEDSVSALVSEVIRAEGRIDVLINNAGIGIAGTVENVHIQEAQAVFDVNVWGVVRMLQAVSPYMRQQRSGYIINISSVAGLHGIAGFDFYIGSKFALEGITESFRYALSAYNVYVTNINAGPVATPIGDKILNADGLGSRKVPDANDDHYLNKLSQGLQTGVAQLIKNASTSSEDAARVVVNLVRSKQGAKTITDVPFNVGVDEYSQKVLEQIRVHPTGWGGLHLTALAQLPALP